MLEKKFLPDFMQAFNGCKEFSEPLTRLKCEQKVRSDYRNFESGRYYRMADEIHNFLSHLSKEDLEAFKKEYPSELIKIAKEFGTIEDLRTDF